MKIFCKKYQKKFADSFFCSIFATETKNKDTMNTKLDNRVSIYVPSTTEGNKPAKGLQKRVTKHTAKVFSRIFGGATSYRARGYWNSSEKGLIAEEQNIIFSACTEADREKNENRIFALAKFICKYMKQEAVTVEINNTLYFVEA